MKWPKAPLGEVASLERTSLAPEEIESGTNYLGLEHIESGGRIIRYQRVKSGELKSNKFMFDPGTLLYGKLRPYLAKVCIPNREGCCSTDIIPIRPGKHLDIGYLRHLLLWKPYVDQAASLCSGANLPRISPTTLLSIEIPLPPLEEQRRIAAILDRAAKVRGLATQSLTRASRSLYESIFSRDVLKAHHCIGRIGDIAEQLPSGYGSDPGLSPYGAPVAKVSNITAEGRFHREFECRSFAKSELDKLLVNEHDLLVVKSSGSKANIISGKTAICSKNEAGVLVASNFLMRLCIDQSAADPRFVWHILNSRISKDFVQKVVGTTTYPNLKWSTYADHPIPLPDLNEQRRIRIELDSVAALSHEKGSRLAEEATNLIGALQQQLIGR